MVVVIIVGILVAIAVPLYNNQTEVARLNAHMANIKLIQGAIQQAQAMGTAKEDIDAPSDTSPLAAYYQTWPTSPGTYSVENGELTANPTEETTQKAMNGEAVVDWQKDDDAEI